MNISNQSKKSIWKTLSSCTISLIVILIVFTLLLYYGITHIDFIGNKDPERVKEYLRKDSMILLEAEFREGPNYFHINLTDNTKIEFNVGDEYGGTIVTKDYYISSDTIIIGNGIEELAKYLNTNKLLINGGRIYFHLKEDHQYDSLKAMLIIRNRITFP